jgi:hypothetical protein
VTNETLWEGMILLTSSVVRNLENRALRLCGHSERLREERIPKNKLHWSLRGRRRNTHTYIYIHTCIYKVKKKLLSPLWKTKAEDRFVWKLKWSTPCRDKVKKKKKKFTVAINTNGTGTFHGRLQFTSNLNLTRIVTPSSLRLFIRHFYPSVFTDTVWFVASAFEVYLQRMLRLSKRLGVHCSGHL